MALVEQRQLAETENLSPEFVGAGGQLGDGGALRQFFEIFSIPLLLKFRRATIKNAITMIRVSISRCRIQTQAEQRNRGGANLCGRRFYGCASHIVSRIFVPAWLRSDRPMGALRQVT